MPQSQERRFTPLSVEEREAIGARIREARDRLGWGQQEMAAACGVTRVATVSDWEQGKAWPDTDVLARLPTILGVSADWLLYGPGAASDAERTLDQIRALVGAGKRPQTVRKPAARAKAPTTTELLSTVAGTSVKDAGLSKMKERAEKRAPKKKQA